MKFSSRSYSLWIAIIVLSGLLSFFAFKFFPHAFPFVHVDITMDLENARKKAQEIAEKYNLGPKEYKSSAMFHTDTTAQTFIELEGGGKDSFISMMEHNLYMPYTWRVRHFQEYNKNEVIIIFTPDGKSYGFVETISESSTGEQLSEQEALLLATNSAQQEWNIDLSNYNLVESSQKTALSNRIDHTFVYERNDTTIGEGLYRLKLVVSGSVVTELQHFIKIPEAFTRRYTQMYSANTTLTWLATFLIIILYLIGGCLIGSLWLVRRKAYVLKYPFIIASIIAGVELLILLNQLPFYWMHYYSAFSIHSFILRLLLSFGITCIAKVFAYTIIIACAEGLTRCAFGNQLQLWTLWNRNNASSYQVLGRTLGGYICVSFMLAFVTFFYLLCTRYLGWWMPSEMRFNPNVLATYAPWLSSLGQSLSAGFIEECLFRAIPLAGAALLGNYFGKKNWFIAIGFIVQAFIFGAAHANYPVQPSYARLIELLIPSFFWGVTYLWFGLLPNIIAHFTYDVIWFSLPIFVSQTTEALRYKVIIILGVFLPLLIVLYNRIRNGKWTLFSEKEYNNAWKPLESEEATDHSVPIHEPRTMYKQTKIVIIFLGICGFISWVWFTPFSHNGKSILLSRNEAIEQSDTFLKGKSSILTPPWKTLASVFYDYSMDPSLALQHIFIWRENKELYENLLGTYLQPAHWIIRYAQFDTDLLQRAEEHRTLLWNDTVFRHYHQLPETSLGSKLTQHQARLIAHEALQKNFNKNSHDVIEISAEQNQLPNRINWLFTFSDSAYSLQKGQARIAITIAGDSVIDAAQFIYVPEEWERAEQNNQNITQIISIILMLLLVILVLIVIMRVIKKSTKVIFSKKLFFIITIFVTSLALIDGINGWGNTVATFSTSIPFNNQLFITLTSLFLFSFLKMVCLTALITLVLSYKAAHSLSSNWLTITSGFCIGIFFAGVMNVAHYVVPTHVPLWPQYYTLIYYSPVLGSLFLTSIHYLLCTAKASFIFIIMEKATEFWQKRSLLLKSIFCLYGISLLKLTLIKSIPLWLLIGTILGCIIHSLYRYIFRYNYSFIPLATAGFTLLEIFQQGAFKAHPYAITQAIVNSIIIIVLSSVWYWYIHKK